ncbi:hypothetical protein [Methylobacterium sp. WL120]|uniref:hypothetical protein n=1 Tax=Methylobacterium sp. WL120 TaxID=2603887 RepID=UPI0011C95152|nr:hypothetical protein [Methylobacterium sp. WL120]TXM69641.1 hypothetical protein FV229_04670 [Methylobacterium sp. WL120]
MAEIAIVHVNRLNMAMNQKDGGQRHQYIVRRAGGAPVYAQAVEILGRTRFIDPRSMPPLKCGARAWAEVEGEILITEPATFHEARAAGAHEREATCPSSLPP